MLKQIKKLVMAPNMKARITETSYLAFIVGGYRKSFFWNKENEKRKIAKGEKRPPLNLDRITDVLTSGFDPVHKQANYAFFDYDVKTEREHQGCGISEEEINTICNAYKKIPHCQVHFSKSGKGIHVILEIEPIPCQNLSEYNFICEGILKHISQEYNFNFCDGVDCKGGQFNVGSINKEENGFKLIKEPNGQKLRLPDSFQSMIKKTLKKRQSYQDQQVKNCPLAPIQKEILEYLKSTHYGVSFDEIHNCFITHTSAIKQCYTTLKLQGVFDTVASGKGDTLPNCYMYTKPDGVFLVKRYGNANEQKWNKECAWLNQPITLERAVSYFGGERIGTKYQFGSHRKIEEVLQAIGIKTTIPDLVGNRETSLTLRENSLILSIKGNKHEESSYFQYADNYLTKSYNFIGTSISGDVFRIGVIGNKNVYFYRREGGWSRISLTELKTYLLGAGYSSKAINHAIKDKAEKAYEIIGRPLGQEFIGRKWNVNGIQLKVSPSGNFVQSCPVNWLKIFRHLGKNIDLTQNKWCQKNNVKTGEEYLLYWLASIIQFPEEFLPTLFFYGPQNCGKSTFHLAINRFLFATVSVKTALTTNFNDELHGQLLGVIEEIDLSRDKNAANKLKEMSTNDRIGYHFKGQPAFSDVNYMHFIQVANSVDYAAVRDQVKLYHQMSSSLYHQKSDQFKVSFFANFYHPKVYFVEVSRKRNKTLVH